MAQPASSTSTGAPTAALAGIPAGLQAQGVWSGRRQLFVRFAAEAETATMYTADALANELKRSTGRSAFHSISISGRDPLANVEYLCAAFAKVSSPLPVMLDCDGQRPAQIAELKGIVTLAQVTLDGSSVDAMSDRALESLEVAAKSGMDHAIVFCADERTTDAHTLRIIERVHATSERAQIVVHPSASTPVDRDRRWTMLFERASALHGDVRLALRLPPPTGMR
jgi:organic radical activating enzyme